MKKVGLYCIVILLLSCTKKEKLDKEINFSTTDIDLFWNTFDSITPNYTADNFQNSYINNGSLGLKDYAKLKDLANSLEQRLNQQPYLDYYLSIRSNCDDYSNQTEVAKEGMNRLKDTYADTEIFDIYFLIGALSAGGKVSDNGLLIAVEMFSNIEGNSLNGLAEIYQSAIKTKDYIPSVILHELIHKQQNPNFRNVTYSTVLEHSIMEGMADYLSKYFLPDEPFMNDYLHEYADTIEEKIWYDFKNDINKDRRDTDWLYSDNSINTLGYMRDMGYYMGYKIVESYINTFKNQNEGIIYLLSSSDYYEIFEKSEYEMKFE